MNNKEYPIGKFGTIFFGILIIGSVILVPFIYDKETKTNVDNISQGNENKLKNATSEESNLKNKPFIEGINEVFKLIYKGKAHMENMSGKASCEIYGKTLDAMLTYEFTNFGIRNEFGKIIFDNNGDGKFKCNNGNCIYDIHIDDTTLTIKGNDWGCDLKRK